MDRDEFFRVTKVILAALGRGAVIALWTVRELLRTAWSIARGPLIFALNVVAALIILFEEWGWRPLSDLLGRLAKYAPIAALERFIAGLPPYAALAVIALPTTLLLPLKLVAVWLLANGHFATATLLFIGAKIASTALIARVFILTKPALMRMAWFASAYNWFIPWQEALFAQIRASWVWRYGRIVKERTLHEVRAAWARLQPAATALWRRWFGAKLDLRAARADEARMAPDGVESRAFKPAETQGAGKSEP